MLPVFKVLFLLRMLPHGTHFLDCFAFLQIKVPNKTLFKSVFKMNMEGSTKKEKSDVYEVDV